MLTFTQKKNNRLHGKRGASGGLRLSLPTIKGLKENSPSPLLMKKEGSWFTGGKG